MSINDPIGDMLTRIRNGQMREHGEDHDARLASCASTCSTC